MLTRLEVRGFKNLYDVAADFGPFTCIAGANGVGKSNLLDAIDFLSNLADGSLVEASQRVRGDARSRGVDPRDLFWAGDQGDTPSIVLAAEMLVPRGVEDDLGAHARPATTFLRYEVALGYLAPEGEAGIGRVTLESEKLSHITRRDAKAHLGFPHSQSFREVVVVGKRQGGPFLSTEEREGGTVINVHGDGGSRGRPQPRAVTQAGRTVLSTVTTNDNPTVLAARREMQSWRRLALEPSALRASDDFDSRRVIGTDGSHLAGALYRIAHASGDRGEPRDVYARVAERLSDLIGRKVVSVDVDVDQPRQVLTLVLTERGGLKLPARALSEGTLRFLALCVLLEDQEATGLICMEEPENGIHPSSVNAMVELVRDLAVDPERPPDESNPFRQVIVNTHSPSVVQVCGTRDLLFADQTQVSTAGGERSSLTLLVSEKSWRAARVTQDALFSRLDMFPYVTPPPGSQLEFEFNFVLGASA